MSIINTARRIVPTLMLASLLLSLSAYASEIITHEIDSKEIARNLVGISSVREFQVYLPDDYDKRPDRSYPVLYWIPGWSYGLTGYTYKRALDDAIESGMITPTIAVFIDAHERIAFLNSSVFGNWENFLILELIPFIDKEYRTIPDPLARGFMGWSMGGYTAFMLSVLHPGVWGSIGGNDPSFWVMWSGTRDEEDFLQNDFPSFAEARSWFRFMPKSLDNYASVDNYRKIMIQVGASISPKGDAPLLCDFPFDSQGERNPEIRDKWKRYDFSEPETLAKHAEVLKSLLCIAIVIPESKSPDLTNSLGNIDFIQRLEKAGIDNVSRLDMPGAHVDQRAERFIAMAEQILNAMIGAKVSVSPGESVVSTWGGIKSGI